MIDHLRQIAIFAKTVEHGSFRGAARELRLSPSVVSHHISQLEDQLGVALLYRTTRKLALTPEGQRLLSAAQDMFEAVEDGLADISMSSTAPSGQLRITAPSVLAQSDLIASIGEFATLYPSINLSLGFSDARQELIDGGFDLAIRMGVNRKRPLTSKTLFSAKRSLIGSAEYLSGKPTPQNPEDVADWNWLELSPVFHIKPTFSRHGKASVTLKTNSQINTNDARALYHLVLTGAGIAVVPELLAADDIAAGKIAVVLPDWELDAIDVYAEWPTSAPRKGLIQLLVDHLSTYLSPK